MGVQKMAELNGEKSAGAEEMGVQTMAELRGGKRTCGSAGAGAAAEAGSVAVRESRSERRQGGAGVWLAAQDEAAAADGASLQVQVECGVDARQTASLLEEEVQS